MKWYQKPIWIIVLLIIFFPVGLFLMWKYTNWSRLAKAIVTGIVAVMFLISFADNGDRPKAEATDTESNITSTITSMTSKVAETTSISENTTTIETTTSQTTAAVATTAENTSKPTASPTPEPTPKPTSAPTSSASITIKFITENIYPGEFVTLTIGGLPNTDYTIKVYYSSGASTASGLEAKKSDSEGNVSWTWKVGTNTKPGTYKLTVSGGGNSINMQFNVIAR